MDTYAATSEDRNWGIMAHAIPLAALWLSAGFLGFVASLILYVLSKDKSPQARRHATQALNIQLNTLLWLIPAYLSMLILIGFILVPMVLIWATVLHVVGLVKAGGPTQWKAPLVIDFVR